MTARPARYETGPLARVTLHIRQDQRDAAKEIAVQMAVETQEPVTEAEAIRRLLDLGIKQYRKSRKR